MISVWQNTPRSKLDDPAHSQLAIEISRMPYYIALPGFLSLESHMSGESIPNPSTDALIFLYKAILSYVIPKACTTDGSMKNLDEQQRAIDIRHRLSLFEDSLDNLHLKGHLTWPQEKVQNEKHGHFGKRSLTSSLDGIPMSLVKQGGNIDRSSFGLKGVEDTYDCRTESFLYEVAQETLQFQQFLLWGSKASHRILWIDGNLGTGKTMLLRAAASKLPSGNKDTHESTNPKVACSFRYSGIYHQEDDALSVIETLISQIIENQPSLRHHLESTLNNIDQKGFNGLGDFYVASKVFYDSIQDADFPQTYLVIDGLEQFSYDKDLSASVPFFTDQGYRDPLDQRGLGKLLGLISTSITLSDKVKWLLSIDRTRCNVHLGSVREDTQLQLTISPDPNSAQKIAEGHANSKVSEIIDRTHIDMSLHCALVDKLRNFTGNFIWVDIILDMVISKASDMPWNSLEILDELIVKVNHVDSPYDLSAIDIGQFSQRDQEYCTTILSSVAVAIKSFILRCLRRCTSTRTFQMSCKPSLGLGNVPWMRKR